MARRPHRTTVLSGYSRPPAGITLGESLGRFWASDDRFRGVLWPLHGNGNRLDNRRLQQINGHLRRWQTPRARQPERAQRAKTAMAKHPATRSPAVTA